MLGDVSPAKFIPLAEECGLIEQIGLWSIREACRQMAEWRKAGVDIPCVSVNLSPINFQNANLASAVAGILADHGLPPEVLMLEITEGVFLNERVVAIETMNALRKLGIGLSLDDFGTGYSSFGRLRNFAVDRLKIDQSFMTSLIECSDNRAIAAAIIAMSRSLRISVTAEGVENVPQLMFLQEHECQEAQGFLFSRALPALEARSLLRRAADATSGTRTQRLKSLMG